MDLLGLKAYIESKENTFLLSSDDSNLPKELRDFLSTIPNKEVSLSLEKEGISLTNTTLTISGSSADIWAVQGMGDINAALKNVIITIENNTSAPLINCTINALMPLSGSIQAPITITPMDKEKGSWKIRLSQNISGVTPNAMMMLGKTTKLPFDIPSELDVLTEALTIDKDGFQAVFFPNTTFDAYYSIKINAPAAEWNPISNNILSLNGMDVQAFITTNGVSATIFSHLTIGGLGVDIGVGLNKGENWTSFLKPTQGQAFPGLSDLAAWIGGASMAKDISSGFGALNFNTNVFDAAIAAVTVGFNWKRRSLDYVNIKSMLTVGAFKLDAALRLPDITLAGSLHDNQPVTVKDMLSSFGLPSGDVPDNLSIKEVDFNARPKTNYYYLGMTVDNVWSAGCIELEELGVAVAYSGTDGFSGQFNCILAIDESVKISLEAESKAKDKGWQFSGQTGKDNQINISKIIDKLFKDSGISIPVDIPDFVLSNLSFLYSTPTKDYSISGDCTSTWDIPLGITSLSVSGLSACLKHENGKTTGMLKGKASLAGAQVEICYDLSKGLLIDGKIPELSTKPLVNAVCGSEVLSIIPLPSGMPALDFKDVHIVCNVKEKTLAVDGTIAGFGDAALITRNINSKWGFGFGAVVGNDFRFASIASVLSIMDKMSFQGTSLIVSSFDDRNFSITGFPLFSGEIEKGLNFLMKVKMDDGAELSFVKNLLKLHIDYLSIRCAVSSSGTALLEGAFEGQFNIADILTLEKSALRIRTGAGTLAFSIMVSMSVNLHDKLNFTGEISVFPTGARFSATMLGDWVNPFGISGITLSNVAVDLGFTAEPIPTIGIAGAAKISNVSGEMGVLINTINPAQSALHLKFNELGVKTIFDICDPSILNSIPQEFDPILETGWEDVDVHIVPQDTYIGQIKYEKGFRAKGRMDILGFEAMMDAEIDQSSGITAEGKMSPLNFLGIFKLTGANGEPNPNIAIDLCTKKPIRVHISGCTSFLGLTGYSIFADLTTEGFCFSVSQTLYGVVNLDLKKCVVNKSGFDADGSIAFRIDTIGPIKVAGVTLIDEISVNTGFIAGARMKISDRGFELGISGSLEIIGKSLGTIDFTLTASPDDFKALYNIVIDKVINKIAECFIDLFATLNEWANAVKNGVISFAGDVADVAKGVYNTTMNEAIEAYKVLDKGVNEIAAGIKDVYNATAEAATTALKEAGYAVDQVGSALKSVYNFTGDQAAAVLKGAGYAVDQVGSALKSVYNFTGDQAAAVLKGAGYAVDQVGSVLKSVYNFTGDQAAAVLKGAGYAVDQVGSALKSVYNFTGDQAAAVLKGAGYAVDQVGSALKSVYNFTGDQAEAALKFAGYAADQIASVLKSAFGWVPHVDLW